MIKAILSATALIVASTSVAAADSREEFEVSIAYNAAELTTQEGSESVARSIRDQAREVCQIDLGSSRLQRVDEVCVSELVEAALIEIENRAEAG